MGFHPVCELLRSRPRVAAEVLVEAARGGQRRSRVEELARQHGIKLREVTQAELSSMSGGAVSNGFAVILADEVVSKPSAVDSRLVVLLEDIQDPRNLGALLRVCEGAGVQQVLVRDRGSAPLGTAAMKASAGASSWVSVERIVNPGQQIRALQQEGYWVYGADERGQPPWDLDLTGPVVLCLGGEDKGLRHKTRGLCDGLVGLPMQGRIASLNVATAAAALLFEIVRQRLQAGA